MFLKFVRLAVFAVIVVSTVSFQFGNGKQTVQTRCALIIIETVDTVDCDGQNTACTPLEDCKWAKEVIRENKTPQNCGFDGNTPKVCCPIFARVRLMKSGDYIRNGKNVNSKLFPKIYYMNLSLCQLKKTADYDFKTKRSW